MIEEYIIATLSLALTGYYIYKSRPRRTCPGEYLLYTAFMIIVAMFNEVFTRLALTALTPVVEETYKIIGSRLTPAKNPYVLSGAVFGIIEMITYITVSPTPEMFLSRASVIFIHPTSMLIYSYLKTKVNSVSGYFGAVVYHGLWNLLIVMYPWKSLEIGAAYLFVSTLLAGFFTDKITIKERCWTC